MQRIAILGGASGIGAECVRLFKARGDEVVALDVAEVKGADHYVEIDLRVPAEASEIAHDLDGGFDALILNAGLPPRGDNALDVLAVNVFGIIAVGEALFPKLEAEGSVVVTASKAGAKWRDNLGQVQSLLGLMGVDDLPAFVGGHQMDAVRAYNLSKEAMIYWSKSKVGGFLERGLRINSVSPAPVATGILDDFVAAFGDRAKKTLEMVGRAGKPEEIAAVIAFLASPESRWVNGQDILIDGGVGAIMEIGALG